jgi:MIP family channel proteins
MTTSARVERLSIHDNEVKQSDGMANLFRNLVVEFIGDLLFIFIGSLQATSGTGVVGAALAHGITIAVLIMGMGHISGGHFNPAVTLGIFVSGNIQLIPALAYIAAQLLGGFVGSLLVRAVVSDATYNMIAGGATIVPDATSWIGAIIIEILMTYFLVHTVLLTAVDTDSNLLAPLAIGLSILCDIFAGGNVSGASMNPARSLGPCISASIFADHTKLAVSKIWARHYVYWIGPGLGAGIAGLVYKLFLAKDDARILL